MTSADSFSGGIVELTIHFWRPEHGLHGFKPAVQPLRTTSDVQGVYRFENVPPGPYKLARLPEGTNPWIRRVAMRPDSTVGANRTKHVKDVSVALWTIDQAAVFVRTLLGNLVADHRLLSANVHSSVRNGRLLRPA